MVRAIMAVQPTSNCVGDTRTVYGLDSRFVGLAHLNKRMVVAGMLWLAAVSAGSLAMLRYANTPGHTAQAPLQWSAGSLIARDSQRATLVMFVHPRCPCSRASVGELSL